MARRATHLAALALGGALALAGCGAGVETRGDPAATSAPVGGDTVPVVTTEGRAAVPAGEDPAALLGEDPALDALAQACFDEDLFACDTLFLRTEVGTDLEAYSQTCGGRIEREAGAPGCAERFDAAVPAPDEPGVLGDDAELDVLAQECFGGDPGACDDLFLESDVGSDYEAYGSTCGGRLALGSDGGCESQFGPG
ncbi:MAG: hypothetical protein KDB10_05685 [Acidimicrobiales bacterium]|nr:hypothetical protein [Acidimicrobiales bacterium]